jgi:uncharacterized membrane protein
MTSLSRLRLAVLACTTGLILLCLAWELFLAPQRPGGSLLALKALPLIAALPAFLGGRVRAYQWWSMLITGVDRDTVERVGLRRDRGVRAQSPGV